MTDKRRDHLAQLTIDVLADEYAVDFDARPDEAEAFSTEVDTILDGAARAALNAIRERFPNYGVVLRIDGEVIE